MIQKRAPSEVRVGKAASFVVNVRNVGQVEALNVQVFDQVPAGMRLWRLLLSETTRRAIAVGAWIDGGR